jgi:hypothetical protein
MGISMKNISSPLPLDASCAIVRPTPQAKQRITVRVLVQYFITLFPFIRIGYLRELPAASQITVPFPAISRAPVTALWREQVYRGEHTRNPAGGTNFGLTKKLVAAGPVRKQNPGHSA